MNIKSKPFESVAPCFQLGLEQQNEILKDAWLSKMIFGQEIPDAIVAPTFLDTDFEKCVSIKRLKPKHIAGSYVP